MSSELYPDDFLDAQMSFTMPTRKFMYERIGIQKSHRVLDLGCNRGSIMSELKRYTDFVFGIDLDFESLERNPNRSSTANASVLQIPFMDSTFDVVVDHYTLLWSGNYEVAINEIIRVLKAGGFFISIEPDYSGRIEGSLEYEPAEPKTKLPIVDALINAGADPFIANKMIMYLRRKGIYMEFGVLSWNYNPSQMLFEIQSERKMTKERIEKQFFTYTPTFWIIGKKL